MSFIVTTLSAGCPLIFGTISASETATTHHMVHHDHPIAIADLQCLLEHGDS
jgi:hypothetical protein